MDSNLGNSLHTSATDISIYTLDDQQIIFLLSVLTNVKEKLFNYVLDVCITNGTSSNGPMRSQMVAMDIGISYASFKTILHRLISTKLIARNRNPGKKSQSGYIDIKISKIVMDLAIMRRDLNNR